MHRARKRFGQNFLVDQSIINHIIRTLAPRANDNIVEIGPGKGAITAPLVEACEKLQVIELDKDLVPILLAQFAKYRDFKIHQCDALKFNFLDIAPINEKLRIVGNLPYNISTPLIFHLLSFENLIQDMHFMLQKEVVLRLAAKPGEKNYGKLTVMAQYHCEVENLFDVPPESFRPAPKVESAIVRLMPRAEKLAIAKDSKHFSTLVSTAFQQRRKTLNNSLKIYLSEDNKKLDKIDIDFSLRAENLGVADYVALSNAIVG